MKQFFFSHPVFSIKAPTRNWNSIAIARIT